MPTTIDFETAALKKHYHTCRNCQNQIKCLATGCEPPFYCFYCKRGLPVPVDMEQLIRQHYTTNSFNQAIWLLKNTDHSDWEELRTIFLEDR